MDTSQPRSEEFIKAHQGALEKLAGRYGRPSPISHHSQPNEIRALPDRGRISRSAPSSISATEPVDHTDTQATKEISAAHNLPVQDSSEDLEEAESHHEGYRDDGGAVNEAHHHFSGVEYDGSIQSHTAQHVAVDNRGRIDISDDLRRGDTDLGQDKAVLPKIVANVSNSSRNGLSAHEQRLLATIKLSKIPTTSTEPNEDESSVAPKAADIIRESSTAVEGVAGPHLRDYTPNHTYHSGAWDNSSSDLTHPHSQQHIDNAFSDIGASAYGNLYHGHHGNPNMQHAPSTNRARGGNGRGRAYSRRNDNWSSGQRAKFFEYNTRNGNQAPHAFRQNSLAPGVSSNLVVGSRSPAENESLFSLQSLDKDAPRTLAQALNNAYPEGNTFQSAKYKTIFKEQSRNSDQGFYETTRHAIMAVDSTFPSVHARNGSAPCPKTAKKQKLSKQQLRQQMGMLQACPPKGFTRRPDSPAISEAVSMTEVADAGAKESYRPLSRQSEGKSGQRRQSGILSVDRVRELHAEDIERQNVPDHILADRFHKKVEQIEALHSARKAGKSEANVGASTFTPSSKEEPRKQSEPEDPLEACRFLTEADLRTSAPPKKRIISSDLLCQLLIKDLDSYDVPKLGSLSMPRVRLEALPMYKTMMKQIEDQLPDFVQSVPSPQYPFSRRKKESLEPSRMGTVSSRPRDLSVLPGPFSAIASQDLKGFRREGYAESVFDDGVAEADFKIVDEEVLAASRWRWFSKDNVSLVGDPNGRTLEFETSEHDDFNPEQLAGDDKALWQEDKVKQILVIHWVENQTANSLKCPVLVDTTSTDFRSGRMPVSGLRFNYQEFPPDIGYQPVRIHYGIIEWELIPQPKYSESAYIERKHCEQTAHREMTRFTATKLEQLNMIKLKASKMLAKRLELQLMPQPWQKDSSKQNATNKPWIPNLKIHIRIARNSDVFEMVRIYNFYARGSIHVPERVHIEAGAMRDRLYTAQREKYPFLVAVLRVEQGDHPVRKGTLIHYNDPRRGTLREYVVGFARARSYSGVEYNCFEDAALLEVFVAPQYTRERIAANLLDRMIGCLDGSYKSQQGVDIEVEKTRPRWTYDWRPTYTHLIKLFYLDAEDESFIWRRRYLEEHFGFYEVGSFPDFCTKDGGETRYNMSYFQRDANRHLYTR